MIDIIYFQTIIYNDFKKLIFYTLHNKSSFIIQQALPFCLYYNILLGITLTLIRGFRIFQQQSKNILSKPFQSFPNVSKYFRHEIFFKYSPVLGYDVSTLFTAIKTIKRWVVSFQCNKKCDQLKYQNNLIFKYILCRQKTYTVIIIGIQFICFNFYSNKKKKSTLLIYLLYISVLNFSQFKSHMHNRRVHILRKRKSIKQIYKSI